MIQFTLESPGDMEKEWMVRPKSSSSRQQGHQHTRTTRKKSTNKKPEETKAEIFPEETLERLKQVQYSPTTLGTRKSVASSPGPLLFELLGGPGTRRLMTFQKCIAGIDAG